MFNIYHIISLNPNLYNGWTIIITSMQEKDIKTWREKDHKKSLQDIADDLWTESYGLTDNAWHLHTSMITKQTY